MNENVKKERKKLNPIFMFILGIIVTAGTVYAVTLIPANQVSYTNTTGYIDADNVQGAIEKVYASVVDYNSLKTERDNYYNIVSLGGSSNTPKVVFKQNANYTTLTETFPFHGPDGQNTVCNSGSSSSSCSFNVVHNQGTADSNTGRWVAPIKKGSYYEYYDYDATMMSYLCTYKVKARITDESGVINVTLYKNTLRLVDSGGNSEYSAECDSTATSLFNKDNFTFSTTYLNNIDLNYVEQ